MVEKRHARRAMKEKFRRTGTVKIERLRPLGAGSMCVK